MEIFEKLKLVEEILQNWLFARLQLFQKNMFRRWQ